MTALLDPLAGPALPVVVLVLMVVDTTAVIGLLVPADALVLTSSSIAGTAAPLVTLAAVVGTLTGWSLSWWLGTRYGEHVRHSGPGRRVGERRWARAEGLLRGDGGRILLVVQFLPVLNALIPLLAGALGMPYRRFLRLACVSTVAWAVTYSLLGALSTTASAALGTGPLVGLLLVGLPGLLAGSVVLARLGRAGATA